MGSLAVFRCSNCGHQVRPAGLNVDRLAVGWCESCASIAQLRPIHEADRAMDGRYAARSLDALCWCGTEIVNVAKAKIRAGETESCGATRCRPSLIA